MLEDNGGRGLSQRELLLELRDDVKEVKTLMVTRADVAHLDEDVRDHESRLRTLEKKVWTVGGMMAAAGGAMGAIGSYLIGGG